MVLTVRQFAVRVEDELADRIDAARGDVPRQRWMLRAFESALSAPYEPSVAQREAMDSISPEPAHVPYAPATVQPVRRGADLEVTAEDLRRLAAAGRDALQALCGHEDRLVRSDGRAVSCGMCGDVDPKPPAASKPRPKKGTTR